MSTTALDQTIAIYRGPDESPANPLEKLNGALDDLRYYANEFVPYCGSDNLSRINVALINLDQLLLVAKLRLDAAMSRYRPPLASASPTIVGALTTTRPKSPATIDDLMV